MRSAICIAVLLVGLAGHGAASGGGSDSNLEDACPNFVEKTNKYEYEDFKLNRATKVWEKCYGGVALVPSTCDTCVGGSGTNCTGCATSFDDGTYDLDCTGSCKDSILDAIHDLCWWRYDSEDELPSASECRNGNCQPVLWVYQQAIRNGMDECLNPKWGLIFVTIFSAMAGSVVVLGGVSYLGMAAASAWAKRSKQG